MVEPRAAFTCSACGSELSRERGTGGLCPGCLLELGFDSPVPLDLGEGLEETETLAYRPDVLAEGQVLGNRYRIRALLGRGGMGEVWRAVDLKLRVEVALKSLHSRLLSDERALETLRQEVRMAREVVSPNVCRVFDLVELEGKELVSMEYIDGITLLEILRMRAPLPLTEAREIAAQFLAGLEAIHLAGLVHRDVKPENLMVTRSGRVVLMDFGIAKGLAEGSTGTVSGTPAYMAPEEGRGEAPNARADVFSAGVVLAEMTAPQGLATPDTRKAIWQGIHTEPPGLPETPWAPVLRRAVAHTPGERYASASALARALEEVTLRAERAEDVLPYPGLASFAQEDAEYFFGRELEVEEMWKKLQRPHLLGLIGPSGAGKSSFVRAGLLAVTPTGWRAAVSTPGTQPFLALARALASELAGDEAAIQDLLEFEDPEVAVALVGRWRRQHDQVLLVLDQFEELFTLNPLEVQEGFAELVARIALEADAHVLLAMRDDFLFHCSSQPALSPMFSELTPLRPPTGSALRRALVQPALKCGYRFEDESLVDEMVAEVSAERGALPMLAFAAARLWDHRDRELGLLTREAYEHIGGVGGALAQHAEATLARIGQDQVPIVRELFRNLVTAQGTRAARTRDELLSVFGRGHDPPDRGHDPESRGDSGHAPGSVPAEVLDTLIDARLLTSYELPAADEEDSPQQRIEIIHESLLANWPRLVRWQTQEADSAQLRDQLRQAAQMWEERGHPEDLLWTGTSFDEYQLWRERYSGGLSAAEESFAEAMTTKAERRKRRRRLALAGAFTFLLAVLIVIVAFWRQSVTQAHRAEAQQLLMLGQQEIEYNPTGALAYALASLERADDPLTKLFALEALWRGPTAFILGGKGSLENSPGWDLDFSPDGRWLAAGFEDGSLKLWGSSGGAAQILEIHEDSTPTHVAFGPQSDLLVSDSWPSYEVKVWSIPDGRLVRTLPTQGPVYSRLASKRPRIFTFTKQRGRLRIDAWPLRDGAPEFLGDIEDWGIGAAFQEDGLASVEVDGLGHRFAFADGMDVRLLEVDLIPTEQTVNGGPELVGRHAGNIKSLAFDPIGRHVASADDLGVVRFWDLEGQAPVPEQELHHPSGNVVGLSFDTSGARLAAGSCSPGRIALWDLKGPPGGTPVLLTRVGIGECAVPAAFQPEGEWIATGSFSGAALWPLERRYPLDLSGHYERVIVVRFLPDGRFLVSTSRDGTLRIWPLSANDAAGQRVLFDAGEDYPHNLAPGPRGEQILTSLAEGQVWLVPVHEGAPRLLGDLETDIADLALGSNVAVAAANEMLHVWDLETGESRRLETGIQIGPIELVPDGRLISASDDGIRMWSLADGSFEVLSERFGLIDLSHDGRLLLAGEQGEKGEARIYDLEKGTFIQLDAHGPSGGARLDAGGETVLTKYGPGSHLRVGLATGEAPHVLVSRDVMTGMDISPDGSWVAGVSKDRNTIRLWPVPDLTKPPLHTLPHDELLAKLRTLTNLRVVRDPEAETGWGWALDPFPGWETVPTW